MKAYKCDRCGQFFTDIDRVASKSGKVVYSISASPMGSNVDLCRNCAQSFIDWWEAARQVSKSETANDEDPDSDDYILKDGEVPF